MQKDDLEIWWIRHGESLWNQVNRWQGHSDVALSQQGEEQARKLSERLARVGFDLVFSSDLQRAVHTARLALPGQSIQSDPRLREIHFGEYEGLTRDEMSEAQRLRLTEWLKNPFATALPGGESLLEVHARLQNWLGEQPRRGRIAVFTHGGVIRCNLWKSQGSAEENPWRIQVANCSTTCIRYAEKPTVEWINSLD